MRLATEQIAKVSNFLLQEFGASPRIAGGVWRVLQGGNEKHGDDNQGAEVHLEAAVRHLNQTGTDEESGELHAAHCAARCILTLLALSQGDSQ